MITLSISGHAEGLAASSNIKLFSIKEGSITKLIDDELLARQDLQLPFEVLSIFVEAKPHGPDSRTGSGSTISVSAIQGILKFHTGQPQKAYVLKLQGERFYSLGEGEKKRAIADAFDKVSSRIKKDFPETGGLQLSEIIASAAARYRQESLS